MTHSPSAATCRTAASRTRSCCGLALLCSAAAILFSACGSKTDLLIGGNSVVAGASPGGAGTGGADVAGAGGTGGSTAAGSGGQAGAAEAGAPDTDAGASNCDPGDVVAPGSLLHRYSFEGTATSALDSVGGADGELLEATGSANSCATPAAQQAPGAALDGNGKLVLDGCKGYVNLPNHLISPLANVTIVSWQTWSGGAAFQRYFDFGVGDGEDLTTGQGASYLAVSVAGTDNTKLQLGARQAITVPQREIRTFVDMNDKLEHQVAAVFASNAYVELYRDGEQLGHLAVTFPLSSINDVNDWIGRSQWMSDHTFNGTVNEFRIYGEALTPCALRALYLAGPDAP